MNEEKELFQSVVLEYNSIRIFKKNSSWKIKSSTFVHSVSSYFFCVFFELYHLEYSTDDIGEVLLHLIGIL